MNNLREVIQHIVNSKTHLECVVVNVGVWENLRAECQQFCEEHDEPFSADPSFYAPNFLVMGIPVIAAGRA